MNKKRRSQIVVGLGSSLGVLALGLSQWLSKSERYWMVIGIGLFLHLQVYSML